MSGLEKKSITVDFLSRFTASEQFDKVFKEAEGMSLVEETANYLDGPGRQDARLLDRNGAVAYATESMRLTTRLMQLASWLLLQRAIGSGEMNPDDARKGATGSEQLPKGLTDIVNRSLSLHQRVMKLDVMINVQAKSTTSEQTSHVDSHMDRIAAVFKVGRA